MKLWCVGLVLAAMAVQPAFAEDALECEGETWIIHKSRIIEGGTKEGFMTAIAAKRAWYLANGVTTNRQIVGPVIEQNADGVPVVLDDMIMTVHVNVPDMSLVTIGDAAWQEMVQMFQANAELVSSTRFCTVPE